MATALEKEWNSYFVQLNDIEKKSVLLLLKTFLKGREAISLKGKEAISNRISLEQYNLEIDEALSMVAEGNYISQEEMETKHFCN